MVDQRGKLVALLIGRLHLGAGLRRAELGDGAIEEVDLVVKVDNCAGSAWLILRMGWPTIDGKPLVQIFAFGKFDGFP